MLKKLKIFIVIIILLVFNILYSFVDRDRTTYNTNISSGIYTLASPMVDGATFSQDFHSDYDNLCKLSIRFATYNKVYEGTMNYV